MVIDEREEWSRREKRCWVCGAPLQPYEKGNPEDLWCPTCKVVLFDALRFDPLESRIKTWLAHQLCFRCRGPLQPCGVEAPFGSLYCPTCSTITSPTEG